MEMTAAMSKQSDQQQPSSRPRSRSGRSSGRSFFVVQAAMLRYGEFREHPYGYSDYSDWLSET